jgi:class 3 adenylate cyclase
MQPIVAWLEGLGLSQYGEAFVKVAIDLSVLPDLTEADLAQLGVVLGHRKKMLRAIAALSEPASTAQPDSPVPVVTASTGSEAERRQLTVMFCDLAGSTALSARLDPEDLRDVIGAYHRCCTEVIERAGGLVAKYMGDGVLAYFGYPSAHEDDAERALRAGLMLVHQIGELQAPERLQIRIGIATGVVVVGDLIGRGAAQEQAVVGETPNRAARLQALAEPGTVVTDPSTRRLTGRLFEYFELGVVELKGFDTPLTAVRVLQETAGESRFEALRGASTPFVGRGEELALLERRWGRARVGEGSVVLISGEPGIGKSRLVQRLFEAIGAEAHTRLRSFCSPHHQDSALYPSIAHLERASEFRRDDTAEQRLDKLEALLGQATGDLGEAAPLIAELLSIPVGDRYPPLDLTPQKRKERTLRALVAQVEGLAKRQPVLMLFEDAHWADRTSIELLDLIVDRAPVLPLLLIVTYRPSPAYGEFAPPWAGQPHVTLISLNRLPPRERTAVISGVTGGKALPDGIAAQIAERSVPLFVEELTKAVVESGLLTDAGDHYTVSGPIPSRAIPETLQASLLARLDRLAPVREVAQLAAALGRQFSHELIAAIANMSQKQLDEALSQLVDAELIYRRGAPPDAEYTFKHALVQDAAYSTVLLSRRQQIHARIAAALESKFIEVASTRPELVAFHYEQAGNPEKAVHFLVAAGNLSERRGASSEAIAHYRAAYRLIAPDSPISLRMREPEVGMSLGNALMQAEGYNSEAGRQAFERARNAASGLDLPEEYARAGIGIGPLLFGKCRYQKVIEIGEDIASNLLDRLQPQTCVHLWTMLGVANYCIGELQTAMDYEVRAQSLDDEVQCTHVNPVGGGDPAVVCRAYAGIISSTLGWLEQSRTRSEDAWSTAKARGHAFSIAWAGLVRLRSLIPLGEYAAAIPIANECFQICDRHGFNARMGTILVYGGAARFGVGDRQQGLAEMRRGLALWLHTSGNFHRTQWIGEFVRCLLEDGKTDEADLALRDAEEIIANTEERSYFPEIRRLRGVWCELNGAIGAAYRNYREALDWSRAREARLFELRAATSLASLWLNRGRAEQAHDLLAPVYGWFTEGFDAPDLKAAKTLLDDVAIR